MQVTQSDFVLSVSTLSSVVISIPHNGLNRREMSSYFMARRKGYNNEEKLLSAIVNNANGAEPTASVVRGLLPRTLCDYNRPASSERGDDAVADERLLSSYNEYHSQLQAALARAIEYGGRAYLIDLHGFYAPWANVPSDIVLGSANGATTPCGLDTKALGFFTKAGYRTSLAKIGQKFSGGHTVRTHASANVTALQIEISSVLRRHNDAATWTKLAQDLRSFILSFS